MKALELFKNIKGKRFGNWDNLYISGLTDNSREIKEGYAFFCRKGTNVDGHLFAEEARDKGAVLIVAERKLPVDVAQFVVPSVLEVAKIALKRFYGACDERLLKIGITGTNGKTTVAYLIKHCFDKMESSFGFIGTVGYIFKDRFIKAQTTTPGLFQLWELMNQMVKSEVSGFAMEVSSHALSQGRIEGLLFDFSIFTNLSRDHLDYHGTMENYFEAKQRLFTDYTKGESIVNADDFYGKRIVQAVKNALTYGVESGKIRGRIVRMSIKGMEVEIEGYRAMTQLIGVHNLYNILAAFSVFKLIGREKEFMDALESFPPVRGRLERVEANGAFFFVDYAHTPDALKRVLEVLRRLTPGRLIVVFGCGGNRDRGKRPEMGKIASEMADFTIVTSDNPRDEEPEDIVKDIVSGMTGDGFTIILDRKEAIFEAVRMAKEGDVVLIAGKGHEDYQIIKGRVMRFDDKEVLLEAINEAFRCKGDN